MVHGSADLLARFREGDERAFHQLTEEMGPRLLGYFLRQGAQGATAEDLTQQVFLRVLQSAQRYRERGSLDAYFLRIARNLWIDHRRRLAHRTSAEVQDPVYPGPGPVEEAGRRDRSAVVRGAMEALDDATRELLELAVLQRLPYRDVSAILGIPVGTVKSRVFYSLRRLKEAVANLESEIREPEA